MRKLTLTSLCASLCLSAFAEAKTFNCTSPVFTQGSVIAVTINSNGSALLKSSSPGTPDQAGSGLVVTQNLEQTLSSLHSLCVGSTAMQPGAFSSSAQLVEFNIDSGGGNTLKTQVVLDRDNSAILSDGICMPASCK